MLHRGHLVIALPVGLCPMPLIAALGGGGSIEYPKGDVDALQLLQMVFLPESLRQQRLAFIVLFQRCQGFCPAHAEGQDELWLCWPVKRPP